MFLEKCRKVVPDQLLVLFYGTGVILITFGALLLLEKEAYFSILLVPCIILYCLVKRSLYGWYLIRWMLYVHSAFYLVLFAKGVIWTKLEWMTRHRYALLLVGRGGRPIDRSLVYGKI